MAELTYRCPTCERSLVSSGEVTFQGETFPVFQCDECIRFVDMFGDKTEIAFTFAVDANGVPFDFEDDDFDGDGDELLN